MKTMQTSSRKHDHITIVLKQNVSFRNKKTGFENLEFRHNALPELNFDEIDTSTTFLGKKISIPLIISSMTGGYSKAERINALLAEICADKGIALGVGSQKQALENNKYHPSFSVIRKLAPGVAVFGNIGAADIVNKDISNILRLIDLIKADGFAIHLNPLQELLQPEGNVNFRGVLTAIEKIVQKSPVPIIIKEVGAGISGSVAKQLLNTGVRIIDVAGAGGTSWAGVEILRRNILKKKNKSKNFLSFNCEKNYLDNFWDWGISTVDALKEVCPLKKTVSDLKIIASGGISNGIEIAKSIALGADYAASARAILRTLLADNKSYNKSVKQTIELINVWEKQLRMVMFLTGSRTLQDLQNQKLLVKNPCD